MRTVEQMQQQWDALMKEVNDQFLFGPYIATNANSGLHSPHLEHTGLSLVVTTPQKKIDAWILKLRPEWPPWRPGYVLLASQVEFSFGRTLLDCRVDGLEIHSFTHVLLTILDFRKDFSIDIVGMLIDLQPLFGSWGGAPLKRNAVEALTPFYRRLGLAMTPVKVQKSQIYVRLVWVFPQHRASKPIERYLPVGSCWISVGEDGSLGDGRFDFARQNSVASQLRRLFPKEDFCDPKGIFSEAGLEELSTAIQSKRHGGHQRTRDYFQKLSILREHRELWDQPRRIAEMLRAKGLYSSRVGLSVHEDYVRHLIENLKREEELRAASKQTSK